MSESHTLENPITKIKNLLLRDGKVEIKTSLNKAYPEGFQNHNDAIETLQTLMDKCEDESYTLSNTLPKSLWINAIEKEYYFMAIYKCSDVGYVYFIRLDLEEETLLKAIRVESIKEAYKLWDSDASTLANRLRMLAEKYAGIEDEEWIEILKDLAHDVEKSKHTERKHTKHKHSKHKPC
jgi:inactivated superfamily I helicase